MYLAAGAGDGAANVAASPSSRLFSFTSIADSKVRAGSACFTTLRLRGMKVCVDEVVVPSS